MKTATILILLAIITAGAIGSSALFFGNVSQPEKSAPNSEQKDSPAKTAPGHNKTETKLTSVYNWTMLGHDAAHSGYSDSSSPGDNSILWEFSKSVAGDNDVKGLELGYGKIYISFDKFVYSLDSSNGNEIWHADVGDETGESAISGGKIFVSGGRGLHSFDAENGNKLWDFETAEKITAPTIANEMIYFGSDTDYLYALKTDGTMVWKFLTQGNIHSVPAVANGRVCFGSENPDFSMYCLNATTGKLLWRHTFSNAERLGGMFHAPPTISGNVVLIGEEGGKLGVRSSGVPTAPQASNFYALDTDTGNVIWSYQASDWIVTASAVGYGKVYFSTWDGNFYAVDSSSGQLIWKSKGSSNPVVADKKVFVGTSDAVYAYDADNGNIVWTYPSKDEIKFLIAGDGKIYAGFSGDAIKNQVIAFGK